MPTFVDALRARLGFGRTTGSTDGRRRSRGLRRIDQLRVSWLDFRLGFRMLLRYPGLTVVGGLAFAFAIAIGAAGFELIRQVAAPTIPLPGGDRIVAIRNWDTAAGAHEPRLAYDFTTWLTAVRSLDALGAHRAVGRNLTVPGGEVASVTVAEISASAFRIAPVPPLLGRTLVPGDERPEAAPVLVIGHDAWQARFGGDPAVIGRTVALDGTPHTIVGVMPAEFAFPSSHAWWVPLRLTPSGYQPGEGPALELFGRLAPGATLDAAQAELAALGERAAAEHPTLRGHMRPEVIPFAESIFTVRVGMALRAAMHAANIPFLLFLVLVCGNIAMLTFARAAARESELVVRTALGASRGRLVMQLFAEALVLGGVAAVVGLVAAGVILRIGLSAADGPTGALPFWIDDRLSATTVLYAAALTVLGAAVAGVVPALKVTRGLAARLRAASAGGGGPRFGGIWTAVIVIQVAVTVAFPLFASATWRDRTFYQAVETTFPAPDYLSMRLAMAPAGASAFAGDSATAGARFQAARAEFQRRLSAEPDVRGVASSSALPLTYHPWRRVEVDGVPLPDETAATRVSSASVTDGFFALFEAPVIAGRTFHSGDVAAGARAVVVNESFVAASGSSPKPPIFRSRPFATTSGTPPGSCAPFSPAIAS